MDDIVQCIRKLMNESQGHTDLTSEALLDIYQNANEKEQKIIDNMIMCLCGFKFNKILHQLGIVPVDS